MRTDKVCEPENLTKYFQCGAIITLRLCCVLHAGTEKLNY